MHDHQIMTPRQLYEWTSENISAMAFTYCTTDGRDISSFFMTNFSNPKLFQRQNKLHTKVFSYSSTPKEEKVTLSETVELPLEEISGFVTVVD